jgi:exosortase
LERCAVVEHPFRMKQNPNAVGRGCPRADNVVRPWVSIACSCLRQVLWLAPLLFLWQALIRHLAVEWSVNPQYGYGWAVPFLSVWLIWRGLSVARSDDRAQESGSSTQFDRKAMVSGAVLALAYAPTRLIEEANPEWRLVSWLFALVVVGLTLLTLRLRERAPLQLGGCVPGVAGFRLPAFPFLFFLVAVPWPTVIEGPLIRGLTATIAWATTEVLGFAGIPCLLHGNVIEVGSGMVGIDEACSGIRSFQASLMVALFFGEIYNLVLARRLLLVLAGIACSLQFNLLRTTLLAFLAATKGVSAITSWHDPASVAILLSCFFVVWLLAFRLRRSDESAPPGSMVPGQERFVSSSASLLSSARGPAVRPPDLEGNWLRSSSVPLGLVVWLGLVEFGTEAWYRVHEQRLPTPSVWRLDPPRENDGFCDLPFSPASRQILRFDEGINATWLAGTSLRWQAIFLRWDPGRVGVHLARNHTPEDCLVAAGHELVAESDVQLVSVHGLGLPFRSYTAYDEAGPVHVFYCLWEDRAIRRTFDAEWLSYRNRLASVLAGLRNSGQRSLELALRGAGSQAEAKAALGAVLDQIVKIED